MVRFQQRIDLLNLSLMFLGFGVMLLKKALVLCLKDEYTDSTKLLSPKGLLVVLKLEFFEGFSEPRGSIHYEYRVTITVLQDLLYEELDSQRVPAWEDSHRYYLVSIYVYGCVDPVLRPIRLYTRLIQRYEPPRYPRGVDVNLLTKLPNPLPDSGLRDPYGSQKEP